MPFPILGTTPIYYVVIININYYRMLRTYRYFIIPVIKYPIRICRSSPKEEHFVAERMISSLIMLLYLHYRLFILQMFP